MRSMQLIFLAHFSLKQGMEQEISSGEEEKPRCCQASSSTRGIHAPVANIMQQVSESAVAEFINYKGGNHNRDDRLQQPYIVTQKVAPLV